MKQEELKRLEKWVNSLFPTPSEAEVKYAISEFRKIKGKVKILNLK